MLLPFLPCTLTKALSRAIISLVINKVLYRLEGNVFGRCPLFFCAKEARNMKKIKNSEVNSLARKAKGNDEEALLELWGLLKPLSGWLIGGIKSRLSSAFDADDASSSLFEAYMKALNLWDEAEGAAFPTYFVKWGRFYLQQGLEAAAPIAIPRNVRREMYNLLKDELGEEALGEIIDNNTDLTEETCDRVRAAARASRVTYLETGDEDEGTFSEMSRIASPSPSPEEAYLRKESESTADGPLAALLAVLTAEERSIISMLYGFDGNTPRKEVEVAHALGRYTSSVCRTKTRALGKLRDALENNPGLLPEEWTGLFLKNPA